jgi:tetratricopeptide (TPR) repeat protein
VVAVSSDRYLIDPITDFVGQFDASDQFVTIALPSSRAGEVWSVGSFVSRNRDAVCVECVNPAVLTDVVGALQEKTTALDFWLMLFDPEIRDETKKRIAAELEELFLDESVYTHVQDIVYSVPLSSSASIRFVQENALGSRVKTFANELVAAQPRVVGLFAVWAGMKSEPLVASIGHRELTGRLIRRSFFRKVVTQGKTQADVDQLIGSLAFELATVCNARLVSKALSEYKHTLPLGERKKHSTIVDSDRYEGDDKTPLNPIRATRPNVLGLFQQAEREVAAIAGLYAEGKDPQAAQFLEELIVRQSAGKSEFVVKSLCNIASRISTSGRRDISLQLLRRAIEQPDGLDVILYMQIGNEFRSIREFEKALECYQKAKLLDDGSKADGIRDEIIRVSVAKGEYDLALTQYNEIKDIQEWPSTLSSLGTLHRKMGNLRSARECYWSVLNRCNGFNDLADAGLAEATKQSGNPHRAIQQYLAIFKHYGNVLEPLSVRVYTLAISQLFKITQQYAMASDRLNGLLDDYPLDHDVHFQLAKVYLLSGQNNLAAKHAQLAKVPDLSGIAAELFRFAMSKSSAIGVLGNQFDGPSTVSISAYLPEERGLAGCRNAVAAIVDKQYDKALDTLSKLHFVDKIHKDFSSVLRFHANRGLDSAYDFRKDESVCRILKRGFLPLRQTARSIADARFDNALQQELRFCLHVA